MFNSLSLVNILDISLKPAFKTKVLFFLFCIGLSFHVLAQTFPPTNGTTNCNNCAPPGWFDAGGTPDVSSATLASSLGTGGGNTRWVVAPGSNTVITLPLPPNGHTNWLSLRDLGSGGTEESVSTTISSLIIGEEYEVTAYALTVVTEQDANNVPYGGTYNDAFSFETGGVVTSVPSISVNTWGIYKLRFVASATSQTLVLRPGNNGAATGITTADFFLFEPIQISLTINAANAVPIADSNSDFTIVDVPVTFNIASTDTDPDGNVVLSTIDLDPSNPGFQSSFITPDGLWTVDGSGNVTFSPNPGFIGTASIPYTINDNYVLDGLDASATSNQAIISVTVLPDSDGDGIDDITDLDDDNDGILDVDENCTTISTSQTLDFEEIYSSGGANYANGTYGVGTLNAYAWTINSGALPTDQANGFNIATQGSDDGIRLAGVGSYTIDFVETVNNLKIKIPEFEEGPYGSSAGHERIVVNVYDIQNNLINADLYIDVIGNSVVNSALVNTFDGAPGSPPAGNQDLFGQVSFDFGALLIDRIEISFDNNIGTLRMVEPTFDAVETNCLDTDSDGISDYLDTDSDNDGCPDAIEGAGNFDSGDLVNSGTDDSLAGSVDSDGVPTITGSPQATTAAVVTSDVISSVTISPDPAEVCEDSNITLTANAVGSRVTDFGSSGATFDDVTTPLVAADFIYRWYKNSAPTTTLSSNNTLNITTTAITDAGDYTVEVTTENNSCFEEDDITLVVNPRPTANAGADATIECTSGSITLGTVAQAGFTYAWTPISGLDNASIAQPEAAPSSTTTYSLVVTETATGCVSIADDVIITVNIDATDTDSDGLTDCEETTGVDDPNTPNVPVGTTDPNDACDPIDGSALTDSDGDGLTDCEETTGNDNPNTPAVPTGTSDETDPCDPIASNCSPIANNDAGSTDPDVDVIIDITDNDSDANGTIDDLTIDLDPSTPGQQNTFTIPGEGTFTDNGDGTVTFSPETGYVNGTTTISYTVNDNDGNPSNIATITIVVPLCTSTDDSDGDGLTDCEETTGTDDPNTPNVPVGTTDPNDACDPIDGSALTDSDGDGLTDCEETTGNDNPNTPNVPVGTTDPNDACDPIDGSALTDSDGDGLTDCEETTGNDNPNTPNIPVGITDPNDACDPIDGSALTDSDGDGLTDCEETTGNDNPNTPNIPVGITDPNDACDPIDGSALTDTDGDGLTDCEETTGNDNPNTPAIPAGTTDPDNGCDPIGIDTTDSDGDGLTDCEETTGIDDPSTTAVAVVVSDPNNECDPIGINTTDTDSDGLTDCEETTGIDDPSTPAIPIVTTDSNDACDPIDGSALTDSDGDGLTDCEETTGNDNPNTPAIPVGISDPNNGCDPIGINTTDSDNDGLTDCEETTGIDDPSTPENPTTFIGGPISNPNNPCDPFRPGCQVSIEVTKRADVLGTNLGDRIDYIIEVTNTGDIEFTNVILVDTFLDGNGNLISLTEEPEFDSANQGSLEGTLLVGETATYLASFTITQSAIDARGVSNSVIATGSTRFSSTATDTSDNDEDSDGNTTDDPTVTELGCLTVFNEFSPNGDGIGDTLVISCIDNYPNNKLEVYNRWGNIVYTKRGYSSTDEWDGTSNGRATVNADEKLPVGTYYYVLDFGDGSKPKVGWLYINR